MRPLDRNISNPCRVNSRILSLLPQATTQRALLPMRWSRRSGSRVPLVCRAVTKANTIQIQVWLWWMKVTLMGMGRRWHLATSSMPITWVLDLYRPPFLVWSPRTWLEVPHALPALMCPKRRPIPRGGRPRFRAQTAPVFPHQHTSHRCLSGVSNSLARICSVSYFCFHFPALSAVLAAQFRAKVFNPAACNCRFRLRSFSREGNVGPCPWLEGFYGKRGRRRVF